MHGNGHAGFGGRPAETDWRQRRHRAAGRPHTFRLTSRRDWDAIKRAVKLIYTAPNESAARVGLDELAETWGARYPAMIRLWENAWAEFIPFLDYDIEIRTVICSTNAIESLNARYRRAVKARGHFPTEQAATEMPVLGDPVAGPDRERPGTMDHEVEASPERVRHHLRRPLAGSRNLLMKTAGNTVPVTDPAGTQLTPRLNPVEAWRHAGGWQCLVCPPSG